MRLAFGSEKFLEQVLSLPRRQQEAPTTTDSQPAEMSQLSGVPFPNREPVSLDDTMLFFYGATEIAY